MVTSFAGITDGISSCQPEKVQPIFSAAGSAVTSLL